MARGILSFYSLDLAIVSGSQGQDLEFISQMKKYREAKIVMVRQTRVVEKAVLAPLDLNGIA